MAKWGEGDPRWIVEERPDAINVNNWHWTEKNACGWSKTKFKELFKDLVIKNEVIQCKITDIDRCEGEAVANNRKGKLIFFYEWDINLKWKGSLCSDSNKSASGIINIPNLSEENEIHEVDVHFSLTDPTPEGEVIKDVLKVIGVDIIRKKLNEYVHGLKAEFSQGMILPKKDSDTNTKDSINNISARLETKVQVNSPNNKSASKSVEKENNDLSTTSINIRKKFQCTAEELYNALTCHDMVVAFTHGPVELELKKDGEFHLFGGNVHGKFIELTPNSKIIQTWRFKRWPDGHFSIVTMEIDQQSDHTELKLSQTGIPVAEVDSMTDNWERYYWEALKRTFGFGYFL